MALHILELAVVVTVMGAGVMEMVGVVNDSRREEGVKEMAGVVNYNNKLVVEVMVMVGVVPVAEVMVGAENYSNKLVAEVMVMVKAVVGEESCSNKLGVEVMEEEEVVLYKEEVVGVLYKEPGMEEEVNEGVGVKSILVGAVVMSICKLVVVVSLVGEVVVSLVEEVVVNYNSKAKVKGVEVSN